MTKVEIIAAEESIVETTEHEVELSLSELDMVAGGSSGVYIA